MMRKNMKILAFFRKKHYLCNNFTNALALTAWLESL